MTGRPDAVLGHRPWPRVIVDAPAWQRASVRLAAGEATLLALWAETGWAHMAMLDQPEVQLDPPAHPIAPHLIPPPLIPPPLIPPPLISVLSIACPDGQYPSVGEIHPPAIRPERAVRELWGLDPVGLPDTRQWLTHGPYQFLPVAGDSLHQIPVGPVHAGIIEPGHFRFTCDGETVVRLEERLGYTHKGIEALMQGAPVARAARLAGRASGDSTVAYAIAFARAVEAASGSRPALRGVWLRGLLAELERLANHFGDVGAICNDVGFSLMLAHCGMLRERVLRAAASCFGHRLMMDCVVPGGVATDLLPEGAALLRTLVDELRTRFTPLIRLYDETASLQDRTVGTGVLRPALARRFGAGGPIGRASGRDFDARRMPGYPPYDVLDFTVPVRDAGDVNARVWVRITEIEQSLSLVAQILAALPDGPLSVPLLHRAGEGMALVEAFRGDVLVWLRLDADGHVLRCHLRDASWFQWPLLEAAIEGNIVADFPVCNKSFNCSYAGHDL